MYIGFNLHIDKNAEIFEDLYAYKYFQELGENHLNSQKAHYERDLEKYVKQEEIDGTKIQDEWFPQVNADIFISHSRNDKELACALAGWINEKFDLKCFIDSNVWGYSNELLKEMNSRLSNKREDGDGGYIYDHQSCNQVSQHVNTMLSIALQKMIDKVEAVILLNTDNAVKVCSNTQMEKTYSPWIYSEIICTQLIRKKPLLAYRSYKLLREAYRGMLESVLFFAHANISYNVSLKHLKQLKGDDLIRWEYKFLNNRQEYEYALDALYDFMVPNEVEKTKELFGGLDNRKLEALQHAYSIQGANDDEEEIEQLWACIMEKCNLEEKI